MVENTTQGGRATNAGRLIEQCRITQERLADQRTKIPVQRQDLIRQYNELLHRVNSLIQTVNDDVDDCAWSPSLLDNPDIRITSRSHNGEDAFLQTIIDAIPSNVAVLDQYGTIL